MRFHLHSFTAEGKPLERVLARRSIGQPPLSAAGDHHHRPGRLHDAVLAHAARSMGPNHAL